MRDYVNEHMARHPITDAYGVRPVIQCVDGYTISVQGSKGHYSTPKNHKGPYTAVEVWATSKVGNDVTEYPEGYMPVSSINRRIHSHGGPVPA